MNEPVKRMCFSTTCCIFSFFSERFRFARFVLFQSFILSSRCHFHNDVNLFSSLVFWMLMTCRVINPVRCCKYNAGSCHPGVFVLTRSYSLLLSDVSAERAAACLPPVLDGCVQGDAAQSEVGLCVDVANKLSLSLFKKTPPPWHLQLLPRCLRCARLSSRLHQALGSNRSHKSRRGSCPSVAKW